MLQLLFLASSLLLVSSSPTGDHSGGSHEENCVDISRYSEIFYEESFHDICTFRTARSCTSATSSACVGVPVSECEVVGYAKCTSTSFTSLEHDDTVIPTSFTPKECSESGVQTLLEVHQEPFCQNVTKQQCDSKWIVDSTGAKVWDGNENCEEVSWEDCSLRDITTPITVPIYTCSDQSSITYPLPSFHEIEVTGYKTNCVAAAYPLCTSSTVQKCADVTYEQCEDIVTAVCFGGLSFRVPFQTYDHRLKCLNK